MSRLKYGFFITSYLSPKSAHLAEQVYLRITFFCNEKLEKVLQQIMENNPRCEDGRTINIKRESTASFTTFIIYGTIFLNKTYVRFDEQRRLYRVSTLKDDVVRRYVHRICLGKSYFVNH